MRKSIAIGTTAITLFFGGAGVAHATELSAPAATTVTAQGSYDNGNDDSDNTGLWGLVGLLGLLGLAGLKRRKDTDVVGRGTPRVNPPTA
jgi:LPXTG-motif cell wall-anchored protein